MKKVLIITYYWPPSGGAGVQRWLKFVKYLPEFGWEPIIITVNPADASYPVIDDSLEKEIPDNIRVIKTNSKELFKVYKSISNSGRIPYAGFANEGKPGFKQKLVRFVRGNFLIPDPRKGWNRYALKAAESIIQEESGIACILTSSPPHSTQLTGLKLKKKYNIPWLADFRDPWTDIYYYHQFYPTLPAHRKNLRLERKIMQGADGVITVGPYLNQLFVRKHNLDPSRVHTIYNGYDEGDFMGLSESAKASLMITYVGTLSDQYPIQGFVKGFLKAKDAYPDLKCRFIGSVAIEKAQLLRHLPPDCIEFFPYMDHSEAIKYMASSDLLLLIIPDHDSNQGILTGKLFEYLAVRRPILLIGPQEGDAETIINLTNSGKSFIYNDSEGISDFITNHVADVKIPKPDNIFKNLENYTRKSLAKDVAVVLDKNTVAKK